MRAPTSTAPSTVPPTPTSPWAVPVEITVGGTRVSVRRAWPGKARDGQQQVVIEGRDAQGRLRAGDVDRRPPGRARLLPPGSDPALPGLATDAARGELLVHRAGKRAVVRQADSYAKAVRRGRSAAVAQSARRGRELAEAAGLAAPQVLTHDANRAVVVSSVLPGRPVSELSTNPAWEVVWGAWARSWVRLQADPSAGADLPTHTAADEARVVETWASHAHSLGVLPQVWLSRAATASARLRRGTPGSRPVVTHRDLHDKQLLWDGSDLGVLDLDTACLADPALDPANLAVHADLRRAQGWWSEPAAATVVSAAREVAATAGVGAVAWHNAELATVARLACVYAFRPPWRETVLAWADTRWRELTTTGARRLVAAR